MIWAPVRTLFLFVLVSVAYLAHDTLSCLETTDLMNEVSAVVEVLNGCGNRGIGEKACEFLMSKGFDVMFVGNADDFQYDRTLVVDRAGDPSKALAIREVLGTGTVISQLNSSSFVDATVVLGRDMAGTAPWLSR